MILRLLTALLLPLLASLLHAAPPIPITRDISALFLTSTEPPPLFYMNASGKPAPFAVGMQGRGPVNRVPVGETLRLMREVKDPATGATTYPPVLDLPLSARQTPALLVFFHGPNGAITHRLIEDDPSVHPANSVRFLNLSAHEVACKVDSDTLVLQPSDGRTVRVANPSAFVYVYGARQPDGSIFKFPPNRLKFPRDDMRLLVLFSTLPDQVEGGFGEGPRQILIVRDARIFDRVKTDEPTRPQLTRL